MALIQLALYRLLGLDWAVLRDDQRDGILGQLVSEGTLGHEGDRYGFLRPRASGAVVLGQFIHQTAETLTDFLPTLSGLQEVEKEIYTFERYWAVVWAGAGVAGLQRRRLPATKTLTTQDVERDFANLVSQAALAHTNRFVSLRPFEEPSDGDVRDLLDNGRVMTLRVAGLSGRIVPPDVDLTNPRPDANEVLHEYMDYDLGRGVNEVTLKADPTLPDANVAKSFYAKGLAAAGSVEEVEAYVDGQRVRRVRENRQATIQVEEPITPEVADMLLARIQRSEYDLTPAEDQQQTLFGPAPA